MGASITWTVEPLREAAKVKAGLRNRVMRIAVSKGAGIVRNAAVALAPARFGYLKKSLKIRVRHYRNKDVFVAVVGPKRDFVKTKGKRTRDGKESKKGDPIRHRPANYAHLVERGTKRGARPRRFMSGALQGTADAYREAVVTSVRDQLAAILPRK